MTLFISTISSHTIGLRACFKIESKKFTCQCYTKHNLVQFRAVFLQIITSLEVLQNRLQ